MLSKGLINPKSKVVIGESNNIHIPGGNVLKNLIADQFEGELFAVDARIRIEKY